MSDSIGVSISLGLIKSVVCVYDVLTFPFYFVAQKPWQTLAKASKTHAKQASSSPYSSWAPVRELDKNFIDDCSSVPELFNKIVQKYGDEKCFGGRQVFGEEEEVQPDGKVFRKLILGDYQWYTYLQVRDRIETISRGLLACGVRSGDNVIIFAETRLEWMLSALAIFRIGATVATLYATLGEDGIIHGINETEVTHIITNFDLLPKLQRIIPRVPLVRCIIYMEGHKQPKLDGFDSKIKLISFSQLENSGQQSGDFRVEPPKSNTTAVLMYTSGSTGVPKGVMITHKNLLTSINAFHTISHMLNQKDVYMGYLPLAHVLEMAAEFFMLAQGISVGYATPLTLTDRSTGIKKGCSGDAVLLKPTIMTAVPLVLDRIRKGIFEQIEQKGKFFSALFKFALSYKKFWKRKGFNTPILNFLICRKIKAMLGGRIRVLATGSAPLSPETHDFIRHTLDIVLLQGYGLTESTASATLMDWDDLTAGRVGPPLSGVRIKLTDWAEGGYRVTDKPNARGEIVIGGKNITAGYYKNEAMTKECYKDEDGIRWFYTGDIGEAHPDGSFKIIDRKKDLVKLQYGEYISLGKVETELKGSNFVDNVCVYGDSFHSNLVALVVPNSKSIRAIAAQVGNTSNNIGDWCKDPKIIAEFTNELTRYGLKSGLSKMEIPTKIKLCTDEWTPDNDLVTAALKLKRKNIQNYYQADIDRMYGKTSNGFKNVKSA